MFGIYYNQYMQHYIALIIISISLIVLIKAIHNVYKIRHEINSVKNRRNLNFIYLNIIVAILFILGYSLYSLFLIFKIDYYNVILTALLFGLNSVFLLIASVLTYEMGKLLFKIDNMRKRDAMTGVYNHSQIQNIIAKEFSRCQRYQRVASLVMFDINKFKAINDLYGHLAGDKVILDLVATIKTEARNTDILGRYGGDEFILVMPETNLEAAQKFADRVKQIIAARKIYYENNIITYAVSTGISAVNFNHSNYENWLRITDKDLYKSKSLEIYQKDNLK